MSGDHIEIGLFVANHEHCQAMAAANKAIGLEFERMGHNQPLFARMAFNSPFDAMTFMLAMKADPERAAMFKMFWSGE